MAGPERPTSGRSRTSRLAAITLAIILVIYRFPCPASSPGFAIIVGLVAGGVVAALMGKLDFSKVGQADAFAISTPFHFGAPTFRSPPSSR